MPIEFILIFVSTIGTAVWTVVTWADQQNKALLEKDSHLDAIYINPFLLVAEELQCRLYKILADHEIEFLRTGASHKGDSHGEITYHEALEIVYIIVKYFGWSVYFFQYGSYTNDVKAIKMNTTISDLFADRNVFGDDAFSFTHTRQHSLGQRFVKRILASHAAYPEFRAATLYEFDKEVIESKERSSHLYLDVGRTLDAIRKAKTSEDLEGRERLIAIQNELVDLTNYIESKEKFTLTRFPRKKVKLVSGKILLEECPLPKEKSVFEQWFNFSPLLDNSLEPTKKEPLDKLLVVHAIEGRIRLKVPFLNFSEKYTQELQTLIESIQGVKSIEVNQKAASLIVHYDNEIPRVVFEKNLLDKMATFPKSSRPEAMLSN